MDVPGQYHKFWEDPQNTSNYSISWIGLICGMIAHAAFFCLRGGGDEEIPGGLGPPQYVFDFYRIRTAQCLALDDYSRPGRHKVETLLLYLGLEYLRRTDAQRGTSILLSIMCRLAMHTGLHRDPTHYKEMTTFECEMRRRLWTVITEIDILISFQFGLPANIQRQYFDTQLPKNLMDEDFDELTTELPPERPLTERTSTLYTIVKSRIVVAMGDIVSKMASNVSPTYSEVFRLDKQLEDAHDAIPPILRARPFRLSLTDPIDLIMQRLWIELMYQKSRIILHRRYFVAGHSDHQYGHSRSTCLKAATAILGHQWEVHNEFQPLGRLSRERWFLSSLSTHDFLLADMILCLEISCLLKTKDAKSGGGERLLNHEAKEQLEQLTAMIRTSRGIWQTMREDSAEANRAFKILSRMLSISTGVSYESSPDSSIVADSIDLQQPPSYHFPQGELIAKHDDGGAVFNPLTGHSPGPMQPHTPRAQEQHPGTAWAAGAAGTGGVEWFSARIPGADASKTDHIVEPALSGDWVSSVTVPGNNAVYQSS